MIKEFICPNGRMSINGVCPIFEGDDGQIKDFNKPNKGVFPNKDGITYNKFIIK